jgi:hypothetical protein
LRFNEGGWSEFVYLDSFQKLRPGAFETSPLAAGGSTV